MALVLRTAPVYSPPKTGGISGVAKDTASWLKDYITAVKHGRWHPFTLLERKTREATRNEPWGPTGTLLNELADASFSHADCRIIFAVLFFRLGYPAAKWRNVYKGLTVLDFLLKRGSDQAVAIAREELMYRLEDLTRFEYITPEGRDQGINVRHRAQAILALLRDPERLDRERRDFAARRPALSGFSRDAAPIGLGLSSAATFVSQVTRDHRANGGAAGGAGGLQDGRATSPDLRGKEAGEMKGVTLEENRKHLAALRLLLRRPENGKCADCSGGGRPAWASINCGVFICLSCAGLHRGLGVHVSQVRSCSLDTWLPGQVAFMTATGNAVANAYWAGRRGAAARLPASSPGLAAHLERKYRDHAFAAPDGVWPPVEALKAVAEANGVHEEPEQTVADEPEPDPAPQPPSPPPPPRTMPTVVASPPRPAPQPSLMDEELDAEAGFRAAGAIAREHQEGDEVEVVTRQLSAETSVSTTATGVPHSQPPQHRQQPEHIPVTAPVHRPVQLPRPVQRAAFDAALLDGTPRAFEAGLQAAYGLQPSAPAPVLANGFRHAGGLSPAQLPTNDDHAIPDGHRTAARVPPQQTQPVPELKSRPRALADELQRKAPQGFLLPGQDSSAGYLRGSQPPENPYLAAQRLAKQQAGLSQQQRRLQQLQQWARASAGASAQLPLLRGPVVSSAAAVLPSQPTPSTEQAALARPVSTVSGGASTATPAWQAQGGGPPSPAAAAAQAALRRLAEARGEAAPQHPVVILEAARSPKEATETHTVLQPTSQPARPRPRPYRPPGLRPPAPLTPPVLNGDGDNAASGLRVKSPPHAVDGIGSSGVGFRMPLAPTLTPLQAMRQQLVSRSLAALGASDANEAAAASERQPATAVGAKAAPQPPLAPRRVSLSELLAAGIVKPRSDSRPAVVHLLSDSSSQRC